MTRELFENGDLRKKRTKRLPEQSDESPETAKTESETVIQVFRGEQELLPISGLQHLAFCARQCALIHLERLWTENVLTAQGRLMHDRVHSGESETRGDLRLVRGLPLVSHRLGLIGVADMVEFHRDPASPLRLPKHSGSWRVYPVEYKRGKKKSGDHDEVQLCAQAICLEEMLNVSIPEGSLYYGQTRSRTIVPLNESLRRETERLAVDFRRLMEAGITPAPAVGEQCKSCSLADECLPKMSGKASAYLLRMIDQALRD